MLHTIRYEAQPRLKENNDIGVERSCGVVPVAYGTFIELSANSTESTSWSELKKRRHLGTPLLY
jgi:hypothetical protein